MAKYVFFSFDYDDVKNFKVNIVRKSWLLGNKKESFIDSSIWGKSKTKGSTGVLKVHKKNSSIYYIGYISEYHLNKIFKN